MALSISGLSAVAFLAGMLTILAPCVLPVLPIILAGALGERDRLYPLVVIASLAVSVVVFTVLLKASSLLLSVSPSFWTMLSG
jgi:cytochrome c-type biogenesis protein